MLGHTLKTCLTGMMVISVYMGDADDWKDHESGFDCGGGYSDKAGVIYVDRNLDKTKQLEVLFHEVIDGYILRRGSNRIRHRDIDPLSLDLIEALKQWEKHHDTT